MIAETYERIHPRIRSGWCASAAVPAGDSAAALRLTGHETFDIEGPAGPDEHNRPRARILAVRDDVRAVRGRRETDMQPKPVHFRHGGIPPSIARSLLGHNRDSY